MLLGGARAYVITRSWSLGAGCEEARFWSSEAMSTVSVRPQSSVASRGPPQGSFPQPDGIVLTEKLGTGSYATVYKGYKKVNVQ